MCLGNNTENETFLFNNNLMEIAIISNNFSTYNRQKLNFKCHVNEFCKKACQKIGALCRLSSYLNDFREKPYFN